MDALIRAVQLAPYRMRLSDTRAPVAHPAAATELPRPNQALREDIEKQLRAEMSAKLQQQFEAERERARDDGLADARRIAAGEVAKTCEELREKADAALAALERAHEAVLTRIESSVGEVTFAAVCRFVSHQAASVEFVKGLVEQACTQLRTGTTATARLHPRDVELLGSVLDDGELRVQGIGLKLVPDDSLPLGGCVVEAASGHFDGGLENQLRRLHAVLTR